MHHSKHTLEFDTIIEMLQDCAISEQGKTRLASLTPSLSERECHRKMEETTEARQILDSFGSPPLTAMKDLPMILELSEKGGMLVPEQLGLVSSFLSSCKRTKDYLKRAEVLSLSITGYGGSIDDCADLREELDRSIRNDKVDDYASTELKNIRRKMENTKGQIQQKLEQILQQKRQYCTDNYISKRNGHYVLPVKQAYKNQVSGSLIDTSASGGTCFIEPSAVGRLQSELFSLQIEEDNEVRKVLYMLTAFVEEAAPVLRLNIEAMESLDVVFAKAKLSQQMRANPVAVTADRKIQIIKGRHPLLDQDSCVPLDFSMDGEAVRGVVITGPNTGGKTVALKTIGLLLMMAQSGLHVPADPDSLFSMRNLVLCDIGDGQSISENLSTFSAHISNIIDILKQADEESLVLLDELGSGTDPTEGMGIAVAILEELRKRNCLFAVTTHYPEIKEYARTAEGTVNARMAFDRQLLKPLYRLEIGEAGESCALYIAERLGFPEHLLEIARHAAYQGRHSETAVPLVIEPESVPEAPKPKGKTPSIQKKEKEQKPNRSSRFQIGDSVLVYPQKETGIVYQTANERGEIGVQIKGKKKKILHKRLKLQVSAKELYPDDYDFSIIFDSVANRKARHQMDKKHQPGLSIQYGPDAD